MLGAAVLISAATPIAANAATYFFDGNGTTAGLGSFTTATGASGSPYTWNDGTTNAQAALWSSTSGGTSAVSAASFTTSDIAQFNNTNGATSGTAVFYNVNIANGANVNINRISAAHWNTNVVIGAAGTTGKITFGGSTPTITNPGSGGGITINAVIDGSSGLTIAGTGGGTTLTATNIFTGGLAITGLVNVSSIGNSNASSQLGAGAVTLSGGTLNYTGSGETSARQFTYGLSSGTIQNNGSGALTLSGAPLYSATNAVRTITLAGSNTNNNTFSGLIANNGTGVVAFSKSGAGKWILSNNNTYTGVTTISGGTLAVSSIGNGGTAGNLGQATNAASNLVISGGTLQYTGSGEMTNRGITFGVSGTTLDASGSGAIVFSNSAIAVDFNNSPRTATFTGSNTGDNEFKGVITDSGSGKTAIVKNGAGKWILSGANTATGIVRIDAGTLSVSSIGNGGAAGGLGQASNAAANLIIATGKLQYTGSGETTNRAITFGGTAGITPTIDSSGSGALILSASAHAYGSVSARTITLTGSNTDNNEIQGVIANGTNGNNSIVKSGAGKWVLSGTNTFTNGVTINAGTLSVATIGNGGQNGNLGASSTTAANLTLGGGTLQYTGSTASTDRNFVLTASTASTIDVSTAGSSLTISGASTNTSGSLTKAGAGTLALSGNNLSTGGMTVSAGTLRAITSTGALGAGTLTLSGGNLELANDTGVNFARNTTVSANTTVTSDRLTSGAGVTHTLGTLSIGANSLQLSSGSNATSGTRGLTFGATTLTGAATLNTDANTNLTVGAIGGNFNLTKSGSGTLTMTGANTSTGDLNIGAGTVVVNSGASLANTNITVGTAGSSSTTLNVSAITPTFSASQKIGGIGTINATGKTVSVAGTWAPGNSIGTNAVTGNLTITGTSQMELGTAGASRTSPGTSDYTNVSGDLILSNSTISLIDNAGADSNGSLGAGAYRLFTYGGTYTGTSITLSALADATKRATIVNGGAGTGSGQGVFAEVYNLASAASTQTVNVGNFRVGSSASTSASITNASDANATYTEQLATGTITPGTGATSSGSFSEVAGGSTGNITVGLSTASTAGAMSGSVTVGLNSTAVNSSGLSNQAITSQVITVNGDAYDYAQANYNGAALDFGYVHQGASVSNQTVAIGNKTITNASYQDLLDVSGSSTNGNVGVTGFNGLAASTNGATTDNVSVGIDSSVLGSVAGTVNLTLTSNANGVTGLSNGTATRSGSGAITTTGAVYSGLGTWATNGNGSWGTFASGFGGNWGSNEGSPGLDAGYTNTDTATFGNAISSDATVSLNGASPKLKSITFNNTSASYTLAQGSSGNITLNAGTGDSAATIDVTGNHEISAVLAGSSAVNKTGTGNLTLSGVNTYSGQTNINAGTLTLKDSGKLNGNAVVADTATLAANNSGTANIISGNLTLADGGAIDLQNGGLSIGGNVTLNGGLINYVSGNTIAVTGALTLTSSVNVDLKGTLALGQYDLFTGYTSITGGNYFNLITSDPSYSLSTSLAGGKFTVIVSASGGIVSGTHVFNTAQTLTTISGGTVTLNASGNTIDTISGGSIAANDDTTVTTLNGGAVAVANGKKFKASSGNTSGVISGAGQLIKEGASKLTLTGNNTFTGKTVVENGTLAISNVSTGNNDQALGKHASVDLGVANTSSGTLEYTGGTGTLDKNINAHGNGRNKVYNNGSGALTLSGNLTKTGTILDLDGGSNGITVSGVISGNSGNYDSDLVVSGGTVTLTNQNTYVGPTYVYGGGTLRNGNASGALPTNTILTLGNASDNSAGTFDLYGNNQTVAGIATAGTAGSSNKITNSVTSTATLTVTNGGAFAGKIEDGGIGKVTALAVTGGNLILSNTSNDYTGGTTISSGANVTATGTHSLGNGDVTVNSGGTLTMLASTVGTAGTGVTYTLNGGSNLIMKFASVSGAGTFSNWYGQQLYDQSANAGINYSTLEIGASGFLDLTGASAGNKINLILQSNNMSANTTGLIRGRLYTFTLATMGALQWNGGDITSLFDLDLSNFRYADGSQFDTNTFYQMSYLNGDSLVLTIPEPSTYGLMLGGLALAAAAVRRQRQKKKATEAEAKA